MRKISPTLTRAVVASAMACALVAGTLATESQAAMAAWSVSGSGTAAGLAAIMPAGSAPTAAATGATMTVRWPAATFANGTPVAGYVVNRYNAATGSAAAVGGTCAGVVATTSCAETVPSGTWIYTDTPVQLSWTGSASPASNTVTVLT